MKKCEVCGKEISDKANTCSTKCRVKLMRMRSKGVTPVIPKEPEKKVPEVVEVPQSKKEVSGCQRVVKALCGEVDKLSARVEALERYVAFLQGSNGLKMDEDGFTTIKPDYKKINHNKKVMKQIEQDEVSIMVAGKTKAEREQHYKEMEASGEYVLRRTLGSIDIDWEATWNKRKNDGKE